MGRISRAGWAAALLLWCPPWLDGHNANAGIEAANVRVHPDPGPAEVAPEVLRQAEIVQSLLAVHQPYREVVCQLRVPMSAALPPAVFGAAAHYAVQAQDDVMAAVLLAVMEKHASASAAVSLTAAGADAGAALRKVIASGSAAVKDASRAVAEAERLDLAYRALFARLLFDEVMHTVSPIVDNKIRVRLLNQFIFHLRETQQVELLRLLAQEHPEVEDAALWALGWTLVATGRFAEATEVSARLASPERPYPLRIAIATSMAEAGRFEDAIALQHGIADAAEKWQARRQIVQALRRAGRSEEALALLQNASSSERDTWGFQSEYVTELLHLERFEQAFQVAQDANSPILLTEIAAVADAAGQPATRARVVRHLAQSAQGDVEAWRAAKSAGIANAEEAAGIVRQLKIHITHLMATGAIEEADPIVRMLPSRADRIIFELHAVDHLRSVGRRDESEPRARAALAELSAVLVDAESDRDEVRSYFVTRIRGGKYRFIREELAVALGVRPLVEARKAQEAIAMAGSGQIAEALAQARQIETMGWRANVLADIAHAMISAGSPPDSVAAILTEAEEVARQATPEEQLTMSEASQWRDPSREDALDSVARAAARAGVMALAAPAAREIDSRLAWATIGARAIEHDQIPAYVAALEWLSLADESTESRIEFHDYVYSRAAAAIAHRGDLPLSRKLMQLVVDPEYKVWAYAAIMRAVAAAGVDGDRCE